MVLQSQKAFVTIVSEVRTFVVSNNMKNQVTQTILADE
jgi:hypothetical protein